VTESMYTPSTSEVRNNMAFGASLAAYALVDNHPDWIAALENIDWPIPGIRLNCKEQFNRWFESETKKSREVEAELIADWLTAVPHDDKRLNDTLTLIADALRRGDHRS